MGACEKNVFPPFQLQTGVWAAAGGFARCAPLGLQQWGRRPAPCKPTGTCSTRQAAGRLAQWLPSQAQHRRNNWSRAETLKREKRPRMPRPLPIRRLRKTWGRQPAQDGPPDSLLQSSYEEFMPRRQETGVLSWEPLGACHEPEDT